MKRLEMGRTMWRRLMALGFHDPGTPLIFVIISVDVMWLCPQTYNPIVRISNFNEKGRTLSPTEVGFHDPGTPLIFVIISVDVMWLCPQTYNPIVRISNFNEKGRTLSPTE